MLYNDRFPETDYAGDKPGMSWPLVIAIGLLFAVGFGVAYRYVSLGESPIVVDAVRHGERAR